MKSLLTTLCLALSLCACATTTALPIGTDASGAPTVTAPLRNSNLDEQKLKLAYDSYDALLTAVDGLVAAKLLVPGSPTALGVRDGLIALKTALNTGNLALKAGNATSYAAALSDASLAIATVRTGIQEIRK